MRLVARFLSVGLGFLMAGLVQATLPLPLGLTDLNTLQGHSYLSESQYKAGYDALLQHFVTQRNDFCGIASTVIILNSLDPNQEVTQQTLFTPAVKKIVTPGEVKHHGVSILELSKIFQLFHAQTQCYFADQLSLDHFRALLMTILSKPNHFLIAQYSRRFLHQQGQGHLSPIAAYDQSSDRVLIMDVASFNYPPTWIKTEDLWKAMRYHSDRGVLVVSPSSELRNGLGEPAALKTE